jgi:AcrR family transcriptional regulator
VGNREALLAGARKCLAEKGYARTTARDIAAAAGVSLAAIGYHFGTTEALLNEAVFQAIGEWGDHLGRILAEQARQDSGGLAQFEALWTRVIESFPDHRGALAASYEIMVRAEKSPEVRQRLAAVLAEGRNGLAQLFGGVDVVDDPERARRVGALYYTILSGLLTQWLVDPDTTPSGRDLAAALDDVLGTVKRPSAKGARTPRAARHHAG